MIQTLIPQPVSTVPFLLGAQHEPKLEVKNVTEREVTVRYRTCHGQIKLGSLPCQRILGSA